MKYVTPVPIERTLAESRLTSKDNREVCDTLLSLAYFEPDLGWVTGVMLEHVRHADDEVAALAVTCLGHIARIHRSIDLAVVLPILAELRVEERTASAAKYALEDIAVFVQGRRV